MDRNTSIDNLTQGVFESLSARRAWIEIYLRRTPQQAELSLSARRAWIEISRASATASAMPVALRKESVDRNSKTAFAISDRIRRSPQGERG